MTIYEANYQSFWSLYENTVYLKYYYFHYGTRAHNFEKYINIYLAVVSSASVVAWSIWASFPWVWSIIIAASQVISAIKHLLPYNKQGLATDQIAYDLEEIIIEIEREYKQLNFHEGWGELNVIDLIYQYSLQINELEKKYIGNIIFPYSQRCRALADKKKCEYFKGKYDDITIDDLK